MARVRTIGDKNLVIDECPECGSLNIVASDDFMAEDGIAWQTVYCEDCNYEWRDVYSLVQQEPSD